jgi:hypothetical protein
MNSRVSTARVAGLLYLAVAILGAFAQVVRMMVYVAGDATARQRPGGARESGPAELRCRSGPGARVAGPRSDPPPAAGPRGPELARAMVVFVAVSAAITCMNMVHQLGALLVATNHSYVVAFGVDGSARWSSS